VLIDAVLAGGGTIVAHDPKAMHEGRRRFGDRIRYADHRYDALEGADALVVLTEWQEYRVLDHDEVKRRLKAPNVVDGRNLYDPVRMRAAGYTYDSIGRP
jgi:UDPglucose 6-dehydrogenase